MKNLIINEKHHKILKKINEREYNKSSIKITTYSTIVRILKELKELNLTEEYKKKTKKDIYVKLTNKGKEVLDNLNNIESLMK